MKSRSNNLRAAIPVSALLLLGACATIQTGSYNDETVDFAAYRTFSWVGEDPYIPGDTSIPVSPLAREKIKNAIRFELEQKGYEFSADSDLSPVDEDKGHQTWRGTGKGQKPGKAFPPRLGLLFLISHSHRALAKRLSRLVHMESR